MTTAHSAPAVACLLQHANVASPLRTNIGNVADGEVKSQVVFIIGRCEITSLGAMNSSHCWNLCQDYLSGVRIFMSAIDDCALKFRKLYKVALASFNGLSRDGERVEFAKIFRVSLFCNQALPNDTFYSHIQLPVSISMA
jgi:hypothetical protein